MNSSRNNGLSSSFKSLKSSIQTVDTDSPEVAVGLTVLSAVTALAAELGYLG